MADDLSEPWNILKGFMGIPRPVPSLPPMPDIGPGPFPPNITGGMLLAIPVPPKASAAPATVTAQSYTPGWSTPALDPWRRTPSGLPQPALPLPTIPDIAPSPFPPNITGGMLLGMPAVPNAAVSRQAQPGWDAYPQIRHAPGISAPSDRVGELLACIAAAAGSNFTVSSTSDRHAPGDPHTQGLATDVLADVANRAALMQAAANCGAVYQQDEYAHPSKNSTGGHLHFQMRPGLRGTVGPYKPQTGGQN